MRPAILLPVVALVKQSTVAASPLQLLTRRSFLSFLPSSVSLSHLFTWLEDCVPLTLVVEESPERLMFDGALSCSVVG